MLLDAWRRELVLAPTSQEYWRRRRAGCHNSEILVSFLQDPSTQERIVPTAMPQPALNSAIAIALTLLLAGCGAADSQEAGKKGGPVQVGYVVIQPASVL